MPYGLAKDYKKSIIAAEVGVAGTDEEKQKWIDDALASLHKFPQLKGWVYFNQEQPDITPLAVEKAEEKDWSLSPELVRHLRQSWRSPQEKKNTP